MTQLDSALIFLDFRRRYQEDEKISLLELRLLLLDERVCNARVKWLKHLRETRKTRQRPVEMTAEDLVQWLNDQDKSVTGMKLEQVHRVTCDPDMLLEAHGILVGNWETCKELENSQKNI